MENFIFCAAYGMILKILIKTSSTSQKMKFSIKDFLSKWDQIRSFLRIWSHLLIKILNGKFHFCAVKYYETPENSSENTL